MRPLRGAWLTACSLVGMPGRFFTQPRSSRNDPRACRAVHAFPLASQVHLTCASRWRSLASTPFNCPSHEATSKSRIVRPACSPHRRFTRADLTEIARSYSLPPPFSSPLPRSLTHEITPRRYAPLVTHAPRNSARAARVTHIPDRRCAPQRRASCTLQFGSRRVRAQTREQRRVPQSRTSVSTSCRASAHAHERR